MDFTHPLKDVSREKPTMKKTSWATRDTPAHIVVWFVPEGKDMTAMEITRNEEKSSKHPFQMELSRNNLVRTNCCPYLKSLPPSSPSR